MGKSNDKGYGLWQVKKLQYEKTCMCQRPAVLGKIQTIFFDEKTQKN